MGLYRIWLNPRGVGRHALNRKHPARPTYHVDIEAPDMATAKKRANSTPLWTGEIMKVGSNDHGNTSRDPGRGTRHAHVYGTDVRGLTEAQLHRYWNKKWAEPDTEGLRIIREEVRRRGLSPAWCAGWGNALTRKGYLREFKVSKIHLDRGGYDSRGRYYGVGAPLYRVTAEGVETGMRVNGPRELELVVRARSAREARAEALRRPNHWGGWQ